MPDYSLPPRLVPFAIIENDHWMLVLNDNQATLGRVFCYCKRPETDVTALTPDELTSLWAMARDAKGALVRLFAPEHFNYVFHMNLDPQVHLHIYPRYSAPREFEGQKFMDGRFGEHYGPDEMRPINASVRHALIAALRHELTQPSGETP